MNCRLPILFTCPRFCLDGKSGFKAASETEQIGGPNWLNDHEKWPQNISQPSITKQRYSVPACLETRHPSVVIDEPFDPLSPNYHSQKILSAQEPQLASHLDSVFQFETVSAPNSALIQRKTHSYSGPSTYLTPQNPANSNASFQFLLGVSSPSSASSSRKSSSVVKERVAKLGSIPEKPNTEHSAKRSSRDILSEAEILSHLRALRRSQSEYAMSVENNSLPPRYSTVSINRLESNTIDNPTSLYEPELELDTEERQPLSGNGVFGRQNDVIGRGRSTVSWKRRRDFPRRRNPFVGVIGRSASVRTDNTKPGYTFPSIKSQELGESLGVRWDSTPSLACVNNSFSKPPLRPQKTQGSLRNNSFSNSISQKTFAPQNSKNTSFFKEDSLSSTPATMKRQVTTASLTAETAELLGTPTPVEFDTAGERSCSRGSGMESNNVLGLVYYVVLNAIRDSIQPTNNKMALKLFGSKKCVMKERKRCEEEAPWIIHPFSTFRSVFLTFHPFFLHSLNLRILEYKMEKHAI